MLELKEGDLNEINEMREFGLLTDIDVWKLDDIVQPTCIICCSDGSQRQDINSHLGKIWSEHDADQLIHEFKDNGLPLKAVNSKIIDPDFKTHLSLLNSIKEAIGMDKIKSRVISISHYPCGISNKNQLSLRDNIELLVKSRTTILSALSGNNLKFTVAIQVDYTTANCGKSKNTYHLETSKWLAYAESVGYTPGNLYGRTASAG